MATGAARAFRRAVRALGDDADLTDPTAPRLGLVEWHDETPADQKRWLEAPDADVAYALSVNGGAPMRMALGRAPTDADVWELECLDAALRDAPASAGARVELRVEASARAGALRQTLAAGWYEAPEKLAFMGAHGHLVPLEVDAEGAVRSHAFVHVLDIRGRGLAVVGVTVWMRV